MKRFLGCIDCFHVPRFRGLCGRCHEGREDAKATEKKADEKGKSDAKKTDGKAKSADTKGGAMGDEKAGDKGKPAPRATRRKQK